MTDEAVLGHMIELPVVTIADQGAFVDGGPYGELFVPHSQLPRDLQVADTLRVFLYKDSGRVYATAKHPYLELGMIGQLRVNSMELGTAYLDMGIPKELVVPLSEQKTIFETGRNVLVYVNIDDEGRLFGTQRFNRFIKDTVPKNTYSRGQRVTVVPLNHTPLGLRVVVEDSYFGLIYKSEKNGEVRLGKRYSGFIANIRDDGKLDVTLQQPGVSGIERAAFDILKALVVSDGFLDFNDKSSPERIEDYLHMSKSRFKKSIGHLYKDRLITIEDDGIRLTEKGKQDYLSHSLKRTDTDKSYR